MSYALRVFAVVYTIVCMYRGIAFGMTYEMKGRDIEGVIITETATPQYSVEIFLTKECGKYIADHTEKHIGDQLQIIYLGVVISTIKVEHRMEIEKIMLTESTTRKEAVELMKNILVDLNKTNN